MKAYEAVNKLEGNVYHVKGTLHGSGIAGPYRMQSFSYQGEQRITDWATTGTHPGGFFSSEDYDFREIENPNM